MPLPTAESIPSEQMHLIGELIKSQVSRSQLPKCELFLREWQIKNPEILALIQQKIEIIDGHTNDYRGLTTALAPATSKDACYIAADAALAAAITASLLIPPPGNFAAIAAAYIVYSVAKKNCDAL
jgi:hypothetical protein